MDQQLNIPYYFPPQRYIPRLSGMGGSRGGPQSGAAGAFEGLSDTIKMLIELKQAKDIKEERLADKKTALAEKEKDRRQTTANEQERRQWHQDDVLANEEQRGERLDEASAGRLERGGAYLMPGALAAARQAGAEKQPIAPGTMDVTSPEGAGPYAGGLLEGAKRGQQSLNADVLRGVTQANETGNVEPIGPGGQYGFARKPPQDERNTLYASQVQDRRDANAIRLYDAWASRIASGTRDQMNKEYPTPYQEMLPEEQAKHDARREAIRQELIRYDPEPTLPGLPQTQPRQPKAAQGQPNPGISAFFDWYMKNKGQPK